MTNERQRGHDIGPTGKTVAANIARARRVRGFSLQQLENRLAELGRRIPVSGLSRIENEDRRVEVDDLMVIALALDISPLGLILPITPAPDTDVEVTGARGGAALFWQWALTEYSHDGDERGLGAISLPKWVTPGEHSDSLEWKQNYTLNFAYGDEEPQRAMIVRGRNG